MNYPSLRLFVLALFCCVSYAHSFADDAVQLSAQNKTQQTIIGGKLRFVDRLVRDFGRLGLAQRQFNNVLGAVALRQGLVGVKRLLET